MRTVEIEIIRSDISRLIKNCKFYEKEKMLECLKFEIGRLLGVLFIAEELNIYVEDYWEEIEPYLKIQNDIRKCERQKL